MRIFLAGASGAIGRQLIPVLVEAGHEVVGTTRSEGKADTIRAAGAVPAVLDALDRAAVRAAVIEARPDVVIHQLTAIGSMNFKNLDASFAATNRLRTEGLDYLLEAAQAAGAKRFIAQSFTGWPNARTGNRLKTEDDPLDSHPAVHSEQTLAAIRHVESTVPSVDGIEGLVLRYGAFYGPGNALGTGGEMLEMIAKRQFPIVGDGAGVFSFVHTHDAATATLRAVEQGAPGVYNIVDDEPAPVRTWLPYLADLIGAKPPRHLPAWVARPVLGQYGLNAMTSNRGSTNAKAKHELGWAPRYPSWRKGFREGLG